MVRANQAGTGVDQLKDALHLHRRHKIHWDFSPAKTVLDFMVPKKRPWL